VYPYITAQIIMQIMQPAIPKLQEVAREGESGRQKINMWTHWLTVPLAAFQAYGTPNLINFTSGGGTPIIKDFGFDVNPLGTLAIIISMTAGTMLLVWMGELITQYGVGQGVSIIIFGGILARLPFQIFQSFAAGIDFAALLVFAALAVLTVVAIIFVYEGQRRIPVQISKQIRGNRVYGGGTTHIPLKVNSAGMIPLIFANSMLILPGVVASYFLTNGNDIVKNVANVIYTAFNTTNAIYWVLYFILVVAFTFFYALVIFQQQNIAENLQRQNGFIPGIRPGRPTNQYLTAVLIRITVAGALFLGIVAILPFFVRTFTGIQTLTIQSTALLIVVGVALDTMRQLEAQLVMRNYRGFISR
jgi:preprotein translocase subunit SecY